MKNSTRTARRPRTIKQIAKKALRTAEEKTQKLIEGVEKLQARSKARVPKRPRKKPVRARPRARAGSRTRARAS